MSWLGATLSELVGLFVDDVPFTAAILLWLAAANLLSRFVPWLDGPVLAAGLAIVLVGGVIYTARSRRGR